MKRRFLTAEDVRRAGGSEIVIDAATLVTPQALELAEASGIRLRTADGEWREPPPDRGPDAALGAAHLPHLPEPTDAPGLETGVVVTAVGRNRPGVLAEITAALAQAGANVNDISQKMVEGYFHMVLIVALPPEAAFGELKQCLECLGGEDDYVVRVMHERVFRFMHRI